MIPQWNELWTEPNLLIPGKKPVGPVVLKDEYKKFIDGAWLFGESKHVKDIAGKAGALTMVDSPVDGGTVGNDVGPNGRCVNVTAVDVSGNTDSTKFTADTANGTDGFWHDAFDEFMFIFDGTLSAETGGPKKLFDIGGGSNGLVIVHKTTPNTISFYTAASSITAELASNMTWAAPANVRIVVTYKAGAGKIFVNGNLDASSSSLASSIPAHTSLPGFYGLSGATSVSNADVDGWDGLGYLMAIGKRALPDAVAKQLSIDPYQILQPATPYDLMMPGAGGAILVNQSADTNTSQAVAPQRIYNIGQTSEINSAFETTLLRLYSAGLSAESDTAFSSTLQRLYSINQSTESGAAFPVTISGAVAVGLSASLESGLGATVLRSYTVDFGQSTESALSATIEKLISSNQSIEVDSAVAVSVLSEILVGQSQESDLPQPVNSLRIYDINVTTETDSAFDTVIISVAIVVSKGSHTRAVILNGSSGAPILNDSSRSANLLNSGNRHVQ